MNNEILLNGISFEQLQSSIKTIISNEIQNAILDLSSTLQTDSTSELLTRKETAALLGISLPTLHSWTKKGLLPAQKIGSRVRYQKINVMNALKDVEPLKYQSK